ncbi:MAG: prepilin-type N-terminal cleavage/methylation domain-containing protein [Lachnospiraceae bacterium]|nr:prepilin-type N-terminal cleavage/methylation domain-containing protein [Lachnospiraceae bacterium]
MKFKFIKKLDNKGMTLIECIIAITVLSVCMIPLLNTFSFCYKYTAKAKARQRATNVAQDVIETYKAIDIKEVVASVNSDTESVMNSAKTDYNEKYIPAVAGVDDGMGYYLYSGIGPSTTGASYDAVVKITAGNINSINYPVTFDDTSTVIFEGPEDTCTISENMALYSTLLNSVSDGITAYFNTTLKATRGYNNPTVTSLKVSRNTIISYSASSTGVATNEVKSHNEYKFTVTYQDVDGSNNFIGAAENITFTFGTVDNVSAPYHDQLYKQNDVDELKSITYFYYPIYNGADTIVVPSGYYNSSFATVYPVTVVEDKIQILNEVDPIDLLIYKQKKPNVATADVNTYATYDADYDLKVVSGGTATYKETGVIGNVASNIYNSAFLSSSLIMDGTDSLLQPTTVHSSTTSNQLEYVIQVYIFGHGEAGNLAAIDDATGIDYDKARCEVVATVVDNIEY